MNCVMIVFEYCQQGELLLLILTLEANFKSLSVIVSKIVIWWVLTHFNETN